MRALEPPPLAITPRREQGEWSAPYDSPYLHYFLRVFMRGCLDFQNRIWILFLTREWA